MRSLILSLFILIGASLSRAEETVAIEGCGDWGKEVLGASCRITTDKSQYVIGDKVLLLIEVKNNGDTPISLGIQPLLEASQNSYYTVLGNCTTRFSQGNKDSMGFFEMSYSFFPSGTESEVKSVSIPAGETYSEIITRTPWGPHLGYLSVQAGKMTLQVSIFQFPSPYFKKYELVSNEIHLTVNEE
ncbi:MAG: hypothetical protein JXR40_06025 [Pontiellaceae bacterium]|nr:hypothetical protein [Pontiellaceae bacterium]